MIHITSMLVVSFAIFKMTFVIIVLPFIDHNS